MAQHRGSIGAGIMYFVLALAFVAVAGLGVKYVTGAEHQGKLFIKKGNSVIGQDEAGKVMIPLGGLGGLGLIVFGIIRIRGSKQEEAPETADTSEIAEREED